MLTDSEAIRKEDQAGVEAVYGWQQQGNLHTHFKLKTGTLFAVGYERIVYGDHGAYVEFTKAQIVIPLLNMYPDPQAPDIYYIWQYPERHQSVKVYYQLKTVADKPNAPQRADGKPHAFNRAEGYADYKVGFYYVSPYAFLAPGLFD
jgi:hypothetical protein